MTTRLVAKIIEVLIMVVLCGASPPLRHAVCGQSLAVRRRGVTTLGVEADASRAPRELPGASELCIVSSVARRDADKLTFCSRHRRQAVVASPSLAMLSFMQNAVQSEHEGSWDVEDERKLRMLAAKLH